MTKEKKKNCFIIMPISTPKDIADRYADTDHFKHVLECLFVPAIEKAGFKPIPPSAKGSDLIHAEIVKHLESDEMVLCDASTLNPNVFYEFGIRTSLNKPVAVVKDSNTPRLPFDTGIIHHHEYDAHLRTWNMERGIDQLSEHILDCHKNSEGKNSLWKYFGLQTDAQLNHGEQSATDNKLDLISMQLSALQNEKSESKKSDLLTPELWDALEKEYGSVCPDCRGDGYITVVLNGKESNIRCRRCDGIGLVAYSTSKIKKTSVNAGATDAVINPAT